MTFKIKIYFINGDENDINMEINCGLLLKTEIKKQLGIEYFTAVDMDTEKPYTFNGKLPKQLLITILTEDDIIKQICNKQQIYNYQVIDKTDITIGTYICVCCKYSDEKISIWSKHDLFKDVDDNEFEVIGKTKCFVKLADGNKRKIREYPFLGKYVGGERNFKNHTFISKSYFTNNKYIVIKN
jgi:hypothetical protein